MSIASEITRLQGAKADLKTAIEGKGVTVPSATKLDGYADLVDDIQTGSTPTGTKNITISANGTRTEDVASYASAQITANVPNSYSASDEGKVVDNGELVAQTSATYTANDTYDTTLINEVIVNVSGGGGSSIDLSDIQQNLSLNNIGGLFTAFENGNWDSLEYSCVSGTNPIVINFGRPIKGLIAYPKSLVSIDGVLNSGTVFSISTWGEPDLETGVQTRIWGMVRSKSSNDTGTNPFPRTSSIVMNPNGALTITPSFPSNASYHPFRFNIPYIFVYWWEEEE